ncbi:MAG: nucleoside-diphosphate sugar epimerase/dehydratase [Maricaulaceae bacterium]|jgi:O-antigen biosynthesis protein WbqV
MAFEIHKPPAEPARDSSDAAGYQRPALVKFTVITYDLLAAAFAMFAGIRLRYSIDTAGDVDAQTPAEAAVTAASADPTAIALLAAALFTLTCAGSFSFNGLHRGVWRFTSLNDVLRITYAVILANLLFLILYFFINRLGGFPRTAILLEAPMLWVMLVGARFARQIYASGDWRLAVRLEERHFPPALLVGRHDALDAFLRDTMRRPMRPRIRVRGLIEPDGAHRGRSIHGRPVLGGAVEAESALFSLASASTTPPQLIIVDPTLSRAEIDAFVSVAQRTGSALVRAGNDPTQNALSPIEAADLIGRHPRSLDLSGPLALIRGRRVMITGAGGTIGAELTRQISRLAPSRMILVDSSEYNLYSIELEMREAALGGLVEARLGDVRDRARIESLMHTHRPHVVLHAAALKHVPLMEENPTEAVLTNVLGTINVAEAALEAGAERFTLISTDKAVTPTNVMGASKRAAELFVQALDESSVDFQATSVRFGNVLGSAGSVIPLFERQIRQGGPITVTRKEMTRYFMTLEEATSLVLQAAANTGDEPRGCVYVLDMGEPVSIDHLARQLCRLRGHEPDRGDIAIVYTGLRPGEKLHESLFYESENVRATGLDGVMLAEPASEPLETLRPKLERLIEAARTRDRDLTLSALRLIAPTFDVPAPVTREDA